MTIRGTVRTALAATACTGVLVGGLAACGTVTQLSTAQKVSGAFGKLKDGKTFKAEVSFDATADQIVAFEKAAGSPVDAKTAGAIADLSLALSVSADKPLKELDSVKKAQAAGDYNPFTAANDVNVSYVLAGKSGATYADIRLVGGKPFMKVDAAGLLKLAGKDPAEMTAVADQLPPELKVFKDAIAGKWISVDPSLLQNLTKNPQLGALAGAASAAPSATPSIDPKVAKDVAGSLQDVLSHNLSFDDQGTKDGVEHIVASAPARALAEGVLNAVKPLAKSVPNGGKFPTSVPTTVPDRKVSMDLYLKGGAISSISFDLAQLAEKAGPNVHLPVKIAFGQDVAPIAAPTGATQLGMSDITGMMGMFTKNLKAASGLGQGTPGLPGAGKAAPLTDAQLKELAAASGTSEDQIKILNQGGMSYEELKALMNANKG